MEFKKENNISTVFFMEIEEGDIFESNLNIYLKTEEVETEEWGSFNAVNLQTGEMARFEYKDKIYKAVADVTIKVIK